MRFEAGFVSVEYSYWVHKIALDNHQGQSKPFPPLYLILLESWVKENQGEFRRMGHNECGSWQVGLRHTLRNDYQWRTDLECFIDRWFLHEYSCLNGLCAKISVINIHTASVFP